MGEEASTDRENGPGVQLHLQAFGTYGLLIGVFQILPDADLDNEDRLAV